MRKDTLSELIKLRAVFLAVLMKAFFVVSCSDDDDDYQEDEKTENTDDNSDDNSDDDNSDDDSSSDDSSSDGTTATIADGISSGTAEGDTENTAEDEEDILVAEDFTSTVKIVFNGTSATVTNPLEDNGVTVTTDGADVTIETTVKGVAYELSGSTTNGSFKLYSEKKYLLTLNGVSITNDDAPAINLQSGKRVFVVLKGENSLADGADYTDIPEEEDAKGAFFSEGQLIFSGSGSLTVAGKYKHGIASDDYVRVIEGTITVSEAVKDGIHTNDYVVVDGGTLNVTATKDAIEAEEGYIVINGGTFNIESGDDGIVASYDVDDETEPNYEITPYVTINGGTFTIKATGEGIESKSVLTINDGVFDIQTVDDGLNARDFIYLNGGDLYVYSTGNDAIDSNGNLTITGGTIVAIGDKEPEGSFDCDQNTFKITGGNLIGIGGDASTPSSNSEQNVLLLGSYGNANSLLHIRSEAGDEIVTFLVPQSYSKMVLSNAKIKSNTTYEIYTGGSVANGEDFHGLYTSGTYSNGTAQGTSFTTDSTVTSVGVSDSHGGGGRPGGH